MNIESSPYLIQVGDTVEFDGTDSYYKGIVVAMFEKIGGSLRCVVEDDRGLLLIKNPARAKKIIHYKDRN